MKFLLRALVVPAFLAGLSSPAAIFSVPLGLGAPPVDLGGYLMVPFPDDVRSEGDVVTEAFGPSGEALTFDPGTVLKTVGSGWASWSHGYQGDVYEAIEPLTSLTLLLPEGTLGFLFYVEPNFEDSFLISAQESGGTVLNQVVHGDAGAAGYGFYATEGDRLASISISVPEGALGFAVGEFALAVPEAGTMAFGIITLAGAGAFGWRARRRA